MFKTTKPCAQCPFRTDIPNYLRRERKKDIAYSLLHDSSFTCHKHIEDSDFEHPCKGAAQFLNHVTGSYMRNVCFRLQREYIGEVDNSIPVFETVEDFVESGD